MKDFHVYYDKEENKMIRQKDPTPKSLKGSKAWRHNNLGNLAKGAMQVNTVPLKVLHT